MSFGSRVRLAVPAVVALAASLALPAARGSTSAAPQGKPGSGGADPQVISGDVISADETGAVFVSTPTDTCSGTLLTNTWAITAAHCQLDYANPASITIEMGTQTSVGAFAVGHPSLDFALVRLATAFRMNNSTTSFRMLMYSGTTASLAGKTLRCRGYGCSSTNGGRCVGAGVLREAFLPVNQAPVDEYSFSYRANARGQSLASGDSGCGCSVETPQGWALAGILKGPDLGRPENWRAWASAYIDGTPIPLPDYWFVPNANRPKRYLTRPLPADAYTDTHSWQPCPGGNNYSFTPTFDLEKGQDFITLSNSGAQVNLTGKGTTTCVGSGPLTATVKTNSSRQSIGLLSMPVSCNHDGPNSLSPTTAVTPAATGVGSNIYFFATNTDGRVLYNRAELGQAGLCWSEVDGQGRTNAAPSAAAVGNHVFVAIKGMDGQVLINQADLGQRFGDWANAGIVTDVAPAIAAAGNTVYFFAKTLDGRIMYNAAPLVQPGTGWREVEGAGRTTAAPAAGGVGGSIFIAIRGLDGKVHINQADVGKPFGHWSPTTMLTDGAPAVTGVVDHVYFFAKRPDGRIAFDKARVGAGGAGWRDMEGDGRTDAAPAAGAVGNHIFVVVKGLDGRIWTNQADLGGPFGRWF